MARLKNITPRIATVDLRVARAPAKQTDPYYLSPEHRRWRELVIERAGRQCEAALPDGSRCPKAEPRHRMFADHIVEREDGGALLDPANGRCLCGSHHTKKTIGRRRQRRMGIGV